MIFDNSWLKSSFQALLEQKFGQMKNKPELHILQIGSNLASEKYAQMKQKMGKNLGLSVFHQVFEEGEKIKQEIENYCQEKAHEQGLIFQLPVPQSLTQFIHSSHFWSEKTGSLDVDFLGESENLLWQRGLLPPTIQAIDLVLKLMLKEKGEKKGDNLEKNEKNKESGEKVLSEAFIREKLDLRGQTVAVLGQGQMVGAPLLRYLQEREATIISLNKYSQKSPFLCQGAQILICAAGSPNLVDSSWLSPNTLVIDAATSESNGILAGDLNYQELQSSGFLEQIQVCPSPKGIGPITVLSLFWNLYLLSQREKA